MKNKYFYDKYCIPKGTAVSAKFRGAFCEASIQSIDKCVKCVIQLDDKKSVKADIENVIGELGINKRVEYQCNNSLQAGLIIKFLDESFYHVVFNDDDTGKLKRNQIVIKGDRHFKDSETLDRLPLTNPDQFIKAVVSDKTKAKSDDEFEGDDQCSQESEATESSNKTRSQQKIHHHSTRSPSVGTVGSSATTIKISENVNLSTSKISGQSKKKARKSKNTKYKFGVLIVVKRCVSYFSNGNIVIERGHKKHKPFVAIIVSPSSSPNRFVDIRDDQVVARSLFNNNWYLTYKRDIEVVNERLMLMKTKDLFENGNESYKSQSFLYFDSKILPSTWNELGLFDSNSLKIKTRRRSSASPSISSLSDSGDDDNFSQMNDHEIERDDNINKIRRKKKVTSDITDEEDDEHGDDNDEVQNRLSNKAYDDQHKDEWVARFYGFWEDKGNPINNELEIDGRDIDIYYLFERINDFGGYHKASTSVRWPYLYHNLDLPNPSVERYQKLQNLYKKYIYPFVDMNRKLGSFDNLRTRPSGERENPTFKRARQLNTSTISVTNTKVTAQCNSTNISTTASSTFTPKNKSKKSTASTSSQLSTVESTTLIVEDTKSVKSYTEIVRNIFDKSKQFTSDLSEPDINPIDEEGDIVNAEEEDDNATKEEEEFDDEFEALSSISQTSANKTSTTANKSTAGSSIIKPLSLIDVALEDTDMNAKKSSLDSSKHYYSQSSSASSTKSSINTANLGIKHSGSKHKHNKPKSLLQRRVNRQCALPIDKSQLGNVPNVNLKLVNPLPPGTMVNVSYGDNDVYKAKIVNQQTPDKIPSSNSTTKRRSGGLTDSLSTAGSNASDPISSNPVISPPQLATAGPSSSSSTNIYYKVHYIGWNTRHDEIIPTDRIVEVLSDNSQDNLSSCSSSANFNTSLLSGPGPFVSLTQMHQPSSSITQVTSASTEPSAPLDLTQKSPISSTIQDPSFNIIDQQLPFDDIIKLDISIDHLAANDLPTPVTPVIEFKVDNISVPKRLCLKRRRSKSDSNVIHLSKTISNIDTKTSKDEESRLILSLNLKTNIEEVSVNYPKQPSKQITSTIKSDNTKQIKTEIDSDKESEKSSPGKKRTNDSALNLDDESSKKFKKDNDFVDKEDNCGDEVKEIKEESDANDESDCSEKTIAFRDEELERCFYVKPNNNNTGSSSISSGSNVRQNPPTKRGRKPMYGKISQDLSQQQRTGPSKHRSSRDLELDSTSSQHSGSINSSRRLTRSHKNPPNNNSEINPIEDDSQTSQDDAIDFDKFSQPLAGGTPKSKARTTGNINSNSYRRNKEHSGVKKQRNSLSSSSQDNSYDNINNNESNLAVPLSNVVVNPDYLQTPVNAYVSRNFIRIHPSLVLPDLSNLNSVERIKTLENIIRQTHNCYQDAKERLKLIDKRIAEIKSIRANGSSIESEEEKFRQ